MPNTFSEIYKKIIKNQLVSYFYKYLSPFISTNRNNCNTQQVLICLLQEWREKLDNNFILGADLMGLSKAFDCIPCDLIIAKLAAYEIETETPRLIYSDLKVQKQCVKMYNTYSGHNKVICGGRQTWDYFVKPFRR